MRLRRLRRKLALHEMNWYSLDKIEALRCACGRGYPHLRRAVQGSVTTRWASGPFHKRAARAGLYPGVAVVIQRMARTLGMNDTALLREQVHSCEVRDGRNNPSGPYYDMMSWFKQKAQQIGVTQ